MIKAILFDADGVLITGDKFINHAQRELNISPEMTAAFFKGKFKECLVGKADLKVEIAPYLQKWGWTKSPDEFLTLWFDVEHHTNKPLLRAIENLRKTKILCYVATNQEKYRSVYIKDYMKIQPLFDGFFASNEIGFCKPDKDFFTFIIDRINIKPEEILFWDDTPAHVEGAKEIGINAELYSDFENFKMKLKDYKLETSDKLS